MNNNMKKINSEFSINQDDIKKSLFTIEMINGYDNDFQYLANSLIKTKIINNLTILNNGNKIMINANSITTMRELMDRKNMNYSDSLKMIYYLTTQLSYLISHESKCFYTYDPNKIIVIDNKIYIYLSLDHLKDLKEKYIYIYSPIEKNSYLSPELSDTKRLPIIINYKTIFYSLGLLIKENAISIDNYNGTKLYYFIKRCLNENPDERYLLFI